MIIRRTRGWAGPLTRQRITINGYENILLKNGKEKEINIPQEYNDIELDVKHAGTIGEFKIKKAQRIKYIELKSEFSDISCIVTYKDEHRVKLVNKKNGTNQIIWIIFILFVLYLVMHKPIFH